MPELTLTVELTEESYQNAMALSIDERKERVIAALTAASNRKAEAKLSQEDLDSIGRGVAETDAGHTRPMSEFVAELRAEQERLWA